MLEGIIDTAKRVQSTYLTASKFLQQQLRLVANNESELRFLIGVAEQPLFGDIWLSSNQFDLPSQESLERKGISEYFQGFYIYLSFLRCFDSLGYGIKD